MTKIQTDSAQDDELSLREVLLRARAYAAELWRCRLLVALIALPVVTYFAYTAFSKKATYDARLTFMLNEEKGGAGIASILGQFGGLFGSGDYQLDKILELARSRRIVTSALFEKAEIGGTTDYFANHFIRVQGLHDKWRKDSTLNGFLFTRGNPVEFSRRENKAMMALYGLLIGSEKGMTPLYSASLNEDSGIMALALSTRDESLSIELLSVLYEKLSTFYIEKSIQREQQTYDILAAKRDSIARALNRNDYATARFDDQHNALLMQTPKVPGKQYQRNTQLLQLMYGEAIKNTELADFALKSNMPFLTVIDVPVSPIRPTPPGRMRALALGIVLGGLAGAAFVIGRKIVREALATDL